MSTCHVYMESDDGDVVLVRMTHGDVDNLGSQPSLMDAVRAEALHVKTASGGGS